MRNALCCCSANEDSLITASNAASNASEDEAALGDEAFHSARQSLSPSMMYPPATVASTTRTGGFNLDDEPQELLQQQSSRLKSLRESYIVRRVLEKHPLQLRGYPGDLTKQELEACLLFRKKIKEKQEDEVCYHEMVYCFEGVEEEAFALCRFMRARKFVVQDAFDMMDGNLQVWRDAKSHDWYPDLEAAAGCPLSVLWTQFPYLYSGVAKNGSIVSYFLPGRILLEQGVECLVDLDMIECFIWHDALYMLKQAVAHAQAINNSNDAVRCENTCVIDLRGLSRSLINDRTLAVMKECCGGLGCFPETLNKMVLVNAPKFFSVSWMVIKKFIDPRTVSKIAIFSNEKEGKKCLSDLISKKELLSDYDGHGPSFDEVLQEQRKDGTCRQVVERFLVAPRGGDAQCEFVMASSEKASIVVYTRSVVGARFLLSKSQSNVTELVVKSDEETAQPYSREIAPEVIGPGSFCITAKPTSSKKEHFLVVIRVYAID